jgi:hypothetical protein
MPRLQQPVVNPDGTVTVPWYRWFTNVWLRGGQAMQQLASSVFFQQNPVDAGLPITAYSSVTGEDLGQVQMTGSEGGPAQPQALAASPFEFVAGETGTIAVFGGKFDVSRDDGVTFYPIGLTGGTFHLLLGDIARVEWYSAEAPTVTWFPDFLEPV